MRDVPKNNIEFSMAVLCYRAEESAIPFVEKLHSILSFFHFNWEIVLVANYWPHVPDRTPEVVRSLCERMPHTRYISEPKEGAMGWDMKSGLDACNGRYIGVIDGDGQYPIEAIFSCFAAIKISDYDFVKTYRVMRSDSLYRNIVSGIYNCLFTAPQPPCGKADGNSDTKKDRHDVLESDQQVPPDTVEHIRDNPDCNEGRNDNRANFFVHESATTGAG